jgi:hypothetical protein
MTLKMTAECFETSISNYPTTQRKNPDDMLPEYKNRFATKKNPSALCHFQWVMRQASRMMAAVS